MYKELLFLFIAFTVLFSFFEFYHQCYIFASVFYLCFLLSKNDRKKTVLLSIALFLLQPLLVTEETDLDKEQQREKIQ